MPDIEWNKPLKDKHGFSNCTTLWVPDRSCLRKQCFHPHNWYYDKRLVCLINFRSGCPTESLKEKS